MADQVWDSISLAFYSADLGTDIYTIVQHINNGHYGWAATTGVFTVLPMIFSIFVFAWYMYKSKLSAELKSLLTFFALCVSPIIPFCLMAWKICGTHEYTNAGVGWLKLFEAFSESLPQAGFQMFVVFHGLREGTPIEIYQWLTIAVSLGFLSFAVTTSVLFHGKSIVTKVTFYTFFLLAIASRFMVCCIFTLLHVYYWFMPIGTEIGILFLTGLCGCCCFLGDHTDETENRHRKNLVRVLLTFGSLTNLCFAIGGFASVTTHLPIRTVALVLSVLNLKLVNLLSCALVNGRYEKTVKATESYNHFLDTIHDDKD